MKIYSARFYALPLPGNDHHGKAFSAWVLFYALAKEPADFEESLADFLKRECWKLVRLGNQGEISPELLVQNNKQHILSALSLSGEFAMVHAAQFSSN